MIVFLRIVWSNVTVLLSAYGIKIYSGQKWIRSRFHSIVAIAVPGTTQGQVATEMLPRLHCIEYIFNCNASTLL